MKTNPFILNTHDLPRRAGEMKEYELDIEAPVRIGVPLIGIPEGDIIEADVRLESVTEGVLLSAEIYAVALGECIRCLDPVEQVIDRKIQELYRYEPTNEKGRKKRPVVFSAKRQCCLPRYEVARPGGLATRFKLEKAFKAESPNFYLLAGVTLFTVILGLIMVLSASAVDSFLQDGGFFSGFFKQAIAAFVALPLMLGISRLPLVFFRKWANIALFITIGLQLLVFTPLGVESGGNRNCRPAAPPPSAAARS